MAMRWLVGIARRPSQGRGATDGQILSYSCSNVVLTFWSAKPKVGSEMLTHHYIPEVPPTLPLPLIRAPASAEMNPPRTRAFISTACRLLTALFMARTNWVDRSNTTCPIVNNVWSPLSMILYTKQKPVCVYRSVAMPTCGKLARVRNLVRVSSFHESSCFWWKHIWFRFILFCISHWCKSLFDGNMTNVELACLLLSEIAAIGNITLRVKIRFSIVYKYVPSSDLISLLLPSPWLTTCQGVEERRRLWTVFTTLHMYVCVWWVFHKTLGGWMDFGVKQMTQCWRKKSASCPVIL